MATIKVKFRPSTIADQKGTIYYQIIHERKVRQVISDYKVMPDEWNDNRSMVTTDQQSNRRIQILSIKEHIRCDVQRFKRIVHRLDTSDLPFCVDDVVDEFYRYMHDYSLFNYMENIISRLRQNGRVRTSETYKATVNSFRKFLYCHETGIRDSRNDIMLDNITSDLMEAYEAWLRTRGVAANTISFYTRILRAVYNRAVEENIIENRHPFRHVYTGVDKTVKRALPLAAIKRIKRLELSEYPALDFARDMFLMSFYLRGMSFIDMAFLRRNDLKNGYVTYYRRKTGQRLIIKWTREMQAILDKYPKNESDYLLPIIRKRGINERCTYRNVGYNINHNLKKISEMADISMPLTLYVARHSWASAAKAKGIPLSVISEGMGHDSEATTQIYLASLDSSVVDKANTLILKAL